MCHVTSDTRHMTLFCLFFYVCVMLLSAQTKRFSVSFTRDCFSPINSTLGVIFVTITLNPRKIQIFLGSYVEKITIKYTILGAIGVPERLWSKGSYPMWIFLLFFVVCVSKFNYFKKVLCHWLQKYLFTYVCVFICVPNFILIVSIFSH